jgi:hypothetical protein
MMPGAAPNAVPVVVKPVVGMRKTIANPSVIPIEQLANILEPHRRRSGSDSIYLPCSLVDPAAVLVEKRCHGSDLRVWGDRKICKAADLVNQRLTFHFGGPTVVFKAFDI